MGKRAPDAGEGRRIDRREAPDAMLDAEGLALAHHRLPPPRLAIQVDAVDRVEEVKWALQLLTDAIHEGSHELRAELLLEMGDRRARVETQLILREQVVSHPVIHRHDEARPERSPEAVDPAEERKAQRPAAGPPDLLVEVPFFHPEPAQPGIVAGPCR